MDRRPSIYAAFPGAGKSFLTKLNPELYGEIECWGYRDGNFPENYGDAVEGFTRTPYLFISTDPVILEELKGRKLPFILVYPDLSLRNEYLDRYIKRDSPYDFIGTFMKHWHQWIKALMRVDGCQHITLAAGECLAGRLSTPPEEEKI